LKKLVEGVGYRYVGDLASPLLVLDELSLKFFGRSDIDIVDMSYNPVVLTQDLLISGIKYDKAIIVGAVSRNGKPGTLRIYRYDSYPKMTTDEIQERIADGVSGGLSLENIVAVARALEASSGIRIFPEETYFIEIEPQNASWEEGLSQPVKRAIRAVVATVIKLLGEDL
jgi:hydrogenase maturation protease